MIGGIGMDVVNIPRFMEQLNDPASRFTYATFTHEEQRVAASRPDPSSSLAARFAAKEAFIKAWSSCRYGHPPQSTSVNLCEIEVYQDPYGRPSIRTNGRVEALLRELGSVYRAHLSLSHDGDTATAFVVLELFPERG